MNDQDLLPIFRRLETLEKQAGKTSEFPRTLGTYLAELQSLSERAAFQSMLVRATCRDSSALHRIAERVIAPSSRKVTFCVTSGLTNVPN